MFHVLRPYWLLALPIIFGLVYVLWHRQQQKSRWHDVCDKALQPYVLTTGTKGHDLNKIMLASWLIACLALTGPSFFQEKVPSVAHQNAVVLALDLSDSMNAKDVMPSRLARAKFKLLDLLKTYPQYQYGMVVFSKDAYVVSPITQDEATLRNFIHSFSTDLMPDQGYDVARAIKLAVALFQRAGLLHGKIMLITTGEADDKALQAAEKAKQQGYTLNVLAIGTKTGAPIPTADGFLRDEDKQVIIATLDMASMKRLAQVGGGVCQALSTDNHDIDKLMSSIEHATAKLEDTEIELTVWHDHGYWLLYPLLLIALWAFRRQMVNV